MLLKVLLYIHIAAGFIALLTGFISMLNRKGATQHRLTGKIFFIAMSFVFITSIWIAFSKELPFLFMVGFFSYYLAASGYRILFLKKLHMQQRPKLLDWTVAIVGTLAGIALIGYSVIWFRERGAWGMVPLAFGSFCLLNGYTDIKFFFIRPTNKQHWISKHGARFGGSFAATLTAFTVVNFEIGKYTWTLWILPGVLTGIWISRSIKNFLQPKRKPL